jgi:hypothetical protein
LRVHETAKLRSGERSALVKDHESQVVIEGQPPCLEGFEAQVVPFFQLGSLDAEGAGCSAAGEKVGEQDATDVDEESGDPR